VVLHKHTTPDGEMCDPLGQTFGTVFFCTLGSVLSPCCKCVALLQCCKLTLYQPRWVC
jgi:hypothetical protein